MLTKEQTVWLSALLRLMGEAGLVAEGAVEAVEESLGKKENKAKEEGDQKKAAPEIGRKAPGKEGPGGGGEKGKFGNVVHTAGSYVASIPPNPKGKFPLVVIFWGNTGKQPVIEGTPPSYFK